MPTGTGITCRAPGMCGLHTTRRRTEQAGIPTALGTGCFTRDSDMSGCRDMAGVMRLTSADCGTSMTALAGAGLRAGAATRGGADMAADSAVGATTSDMLRTDIFLRDGLFLGRVILV